MLAVYFGDKTQCGASVPSRESMDSGQYQKAEVDGLGSGDFGCPEFEASGSLLQVNDAEPHWLEVFDIRFYSWDAVVLGALFRRIVRFLHYVLDSVLI